MSDHDRVLAKAPNECCVKGSLHSGEPKGTIEKIENVDTYISRPLEPSNGHCVLYFPDVYGFFSNAFLTMDAIAAKGYLVLGLDYFRGDPVWKSSNDPFNDPNFSPQEWHNRHMPFCTEIVPKWVEKVQKIYGNEGLRKFACVGYCWGAPFVCDQLAEGGICVAGAFAHPANLKGSHFKNLERPLFLSLALHDQMFDRDDRTKAIALMEDLRKQFHVQMFSNVSHGFALRGDMTDPHQRWAKECSLEGIVSWFDHFLNVV